MTGIRGEKKELGFTNREIVTSFIHERCQPFKNNLVKFNYDRENFNR
jgi:hypothetical protein